MHSILTAVRNKKREKENFQKFPQKFNRCPKRRSYLRTNEQSSLSPCPRKDNRKVNFLLSACAEGEKKHGWNCGGRSGRRILLDSSYQSCTKDAFEKARKGREFDTAKLLPGFEPFFAEERAKGAAMLGRLSHFRAHADKKGGLGAPLGEKPLLKKDHVKSDRPREEGATYGHVRAKKGPPRRVHVTVRCSPLSFEKEQSSLGSLFLQGACSSSSSSSSCSSSFLLPFSQRASFPSVDSLAGDRGGIHSCTHSQNALCAPCVHVLRKIVRRQSSFS